jgi:hypothetical protein
MLSAFRPTLAGKREMETTTGRPFGLCLRVVFTVLYCLSIIYLEG